MRERWLARGLPASGYGYIIAVLLIAPVGVGIRVLFSDRAAEGMVAVGAIGVCCLAGAFFVWRAVNRVTRISVAGEWLTFEKGGETRRHRLLPGSLHASRWKAGGYHSEGTIVYVKLDEQVVAVGIEALLPDDRYAPGAGSRAELYLDGSGAALLERLRPYVMPRRPGEVPSDSTYSILLYPWSRLGLPTDAKECLYIVGDTVALEGHEAKVSELDASAYQYDQQSEDYPRGCAACLRLRFVREDITLTIGSKSMSDWWGRTVPDGERPEYLVGEAELAKLADALGMPRRSSTVGIPK